MVKNGVVTLLYEKDGEEIDAFLLHTATIFE
jgi:hypothetical protein